MSIGVLNQRHPHCCLLEEWCCGFCSLARLVAQIQGKVCRVCPWEQSTQPSVNTYNEKEIEDYKLIGVKQGDMVHVCM